MVDENVNPWADDPDEQEMVAETQSGGAGGNINNLKLEEGRNQVRIVGTYKNYKEHWFPKVQRTANCPGKACPMCNSPDREKLYQAAVKLSDEKGSEDPTVKAAFKKAFAFKPRVRYAINVLDRKDDKIKIWKFSRTLKETIMAITGENGDPNGYDLVITRKGKDKNTKYSVIAARDSEPLTEEQKALTPFKLAVILKPTEVSKIQSYMAGKVPEKSKGTATAVAEEEALETPELPKDIDGDLGEVGDFGDI